MFIGLHYLLGSHPAHLLHGLRAAKTAAFTPKLSNLRILAKRNKATRRTARLTIFIISGFIISGRVAPGRGSEAANAQ